MNNEKLQEQRKFKQFEKPSERLFKLVQFMCDDNSMSQKQLSYWPTDINYCYSNLNEQVSMLTIDEMNDFSSAESGIVDFLVEKADAQELHDFLNDVFDGELSDKIISNPDYIQGVLRVQLPQAKSASGFKIDCQCKKVVSINQMFKCLYCGIYFCQSCASEHFKKNTLGE